MTTLQLKLRLANWNGPRALWRWPFGPKRPTELRVLQRRLAVARLGIGSPRQPVRLLPYEDLQ